MNLRYKLPLLFSGASAAERYNNRVLATSPIRYWSLGEGSGTTAIESVAGDNGTHTGVTWTGETGTTGINAAYYDGSTAYTNIYSTALQSAFDFDEFTLMMWIKVTDADVWSDATQRHWFQIRIDSDNTLAIVKKTTTGQWSFWRKAQGTLKAINITSFSNTGLFCIHFSGSVAGGGLLSAGESEGFVNGVSVGTATGNLAIAGSTLSTTDCVIGAANTTPIQVHDGWIEAVALWDTPITSNILGLATV